MCVSMTVCYYRKIARLPRKKGKREINLAAHERTISTWKFCDEGKPSMCTSCRVRNSRLRGFVTTLKQSSAATSKSPQPQPSEKASDLYHVHVEEPSLPVLEL